MVQGAWKDLAFAHPDWVVKRKDGVHWKPLEVDWFGRLMRFNSPYLDYLCAQIEEVCQRWPDNDGIFLDIIGTQMDYSDDALKEIHRTTGTAIDVDAIPLDDATLGAIAANSPGKCAPSCHVPWPPIEWPVSHERSGSFTRLARACANASAKSRRPQSSQSKPNGRRFVGHTTCASFFGA